MSQPPRDDPRRSSRFSLRTRLLLAVTAVALVGLLTADFVTYAALRSFLVDRIDSSLEAANRPLARLVFEPGERPGRIADSAAFANAAPGAYVEVRDLDGSVALSGSTRGDYAKSIPDLPHDVSWSGDDNVRYFTVDSRGDHGPKYRVRAEQVPGAGSLLVALPLDEVSRTLHRLQTIEWIVTLVALAAAIGLGLWLVRLGLRPLRDIEATAAGIAHGDLSLRVPDDPHTEVGRLGISLNAMLGRIQESFERQAASEERLRRFVADASHELRTPVSAVSAYAELFERGARDRPEDLARVMRGIRLETARMQALIDDLLLLARLDEGRPLAREPVELGELAAEAVEAARMVGPAWPADLEVEGTPVVTGDRLALRQVFDNLLANVRSHTPEGTPVSVRLRPRADGGAVVEVADRGPGLAPDEAARVFERFYRADPSRVRDRDRGGTGLGLPVVAAIVAAHGGSVDLDTAPGQGVRLTITLPPVPPALASPSSAEPGDEPVDESVDESVDDRSGAREQ